MRAIFAHTQPTTFRLSAQVLVQLYVIKESEKHPREHPFRDLAGEWLLRRRFVGQPLVGVAQAARSGVSRGRRLLQVTVPVWYQRGIDKIPVGGYNARRLAPRASIGTLPGSVAKTHLRLGRSAGREQVLEREGS
jgi:hypothetical protein